MSIREIGLTNTLTGKKEVLKTLEPGKLKFYSCGPTVYGFIHIGNLRGGLVADMFYRYFMRAGYQVNFVRNYTDVDDKIIQRAKEEGMSPEALATKYTLEVEKDYSSAMMLEPTHKTSVTTHIPEIIEMIEKIIDNGQGYVVDGEVLFEIEKFPGYGKLSHKHIDELVAGSRVEIDNKKKNPLDFALWKPAKPGEPFWPSPWGPGRPGWHIECSAMSSKWLGPRIDVHHGGEDLIFPHHENEIAQSEAATHQVPFVKVWLHHAFLTLSKEKMSKSLGNVFTARDFLNRFSGEVARYMLLSPHYRSLMDFGDEAIENTLTCLSRIYEAKAKALKLQGQKRARADLRAEGAWGSFVASCEKARLDIDAAYANDFNTPEALSVLFTLIREFNRTANEALASATPSAGLGASELIRIIEEDIGGVLGIGKSDPEKTLLDLNRIRRDRSQDQDSSKKISEEEIAQLIKDRAAARLAKDFALADKIRIDLEKKGVLIKDSPKGETTWSYK